LVGGWQGKRIVEIGSRISPDDLARAMSEVCGCGRPVQARAIPRERWTASLEAQGFPPRAIGPEGMVDGFNSGWIDFGVPGAEPVAGTTTPAQVFAQASEARGAG
jgi:NAD(P)H dehydrogenase (quinone)